MSKLIVDIKDDKFVVFITPYLENTFIVDEIEITEGAYDVIFDRQSQKNSVKEFIRYWRKTVFTPEEE